ncbi:MAG: inositol-3-phosphate synthase [Thermodesulfobacteriota bacterium]
MGTNSRPEFKPLLLIVAGVKGAVGSTLAVAVAALRKKPESVLPSLTTGNLFPYIGSPQAIEIAGWDASPRTLLESIAHHGVLSEERWKPFAEDLSQVQVLQAPSAKSGLRAQVEQLTSDILGFKRVYPQASPVFINLLPACVSMELSHFKDLSGLYSEVDAAAFPDLAYAISAIRSGLPVVNFTSNAVEIPAIVEEAIKAAVPLTGRDGKTGQTYLKVVLASALKARNLLVDGWYSLNILGNEDGKNLLDPEKAAGKLAHKAEVLDEILGYRVGERYGTSSHKVLIDYYPPRGDAKEAWDVIDFLGLFGLPMSLRVNLLARDSILAAPLVLDLARWMVALQMAGRSGLIPELAFYFKKPLGLHPPLTFQDQLTKLVELEQACNQRRS